jgi:hypothetical protein
VGAVTEMSNRLTLDGDDASNGRPIELDDAGGNVYSCKGCRSRTHLARGDDIISTVRPLLSRCFGGINSWLSSSASRRRREVRV